MKQSEDNFIDGMIHSDVQIPCEVNKERIYKGHDETNFVASIYMINYT